MRVEPLPELFERTCGHRRCNNKFKVTKKSKQKFCSMLCAGLELPFVQVPNYGHAKGFKTIQEAEQSEDESD